MRFIEPVGGTIINLFIFLESGIFRRHDVYNIETTSCILLFALGLGVYGQVMELIYIICVCVMVIDLNSGFWISFSIKYVSKC